MAHQKVVKLMTLDKQIFEVSIAMAFMSELWEIWWRMQRTILYFLYKHVKISKVIDYRNYHVLEVD